MEVSSGRDRRSCGGWCGFAPQHFRSAGVFRQSPAMEDTMDHRLSCTVLAGAWVLALVGPALPQDNSAPSGSAAGGVILSKPPQGEVVTEAKKPALNLTDEQQKAVIEAVVERKAHQPSPKEFKPELGATVPRAVDIHSLPPKLVTDIPALKEYMYAHLDREILLVDALHKKVAALIPLPANLAQDSGSRPDQKLAAEKTVGGLGDLAKEQRRALYQSASGAAQPVPQQALLAGADVPDGMSFQPLPAEVVAQAPQVQELHYAKLQDGRMLLIDPKSRKVAGIITQDEGTGTAAADGKDAATTGQGSAGQKTGVSGEPTKDAMREREESGKPSAYSGPGSRAPNN
jgi:hypothetical protein